jgi:4-diphosphocytidyl-2-C-methyl-D-erythritol kinase
VPSDRHAFYICDFGIYPKSVQKQGFSLPSFAKVNLNLRVLGRREDGFHEVATLLQTISLRDTLTFERSNKGIELRCEAPAVPTGETNLIIRAANALKSECGVSQGATIHLEKSIPMGGGLGGGSSNAAIVLIGLSRLWSLDVKPEKMQAIAAGLGSDVPFFLHGGTALATGTGTTIEPRPDVPLGPLIVVTPQLTVSTKDAYEALGAPSLTTVDAERILLNYRFEAESVVNTVNDFEKTVFAAFPEVADAKATLLTLGAAKASMSGSGASVFGIFENEETRQTALKALGQRTDWRSFAVAAVSRSEYREKLGLAD